MWKRLWCLFAGHKDLKCMISSKKIIINGSSTLNLILYRNISDSNQDFNVKLCDRCHLLYWQ